MKKYIVEVSKKKMLPFSLIRQSIFILRNIRSARLLVCQFAGLHALLPVLIARIFGRYSVIVAGGTDCVSFPLINYGSFASGFQARVATLCFRKSHLVLPVHESLVEYNYTYSDLGPSLQGVKAFVPEIRTRMEVIYNGYDSDAWHNVAPEKEAGSFVTVIAPANSRFTFTLKGLDLFIGLAKVSPGSNFYIVGGTTLQSRENIKNLHYLPIMSADELIAFLSEKQFYVQLSVSEGFPNGLSEAMLCECIPIVSSVGGMPDIVGECGLIIPRRDQLLVNKMVGEFLSEPETSSLGKKARQRIAENYSIENRKRKLLHALFSLTNGKTQS